jgi:hypothetical protein
VAEREGAVLRHAREDDLPAIDALTIAGYAAIQESFVSMLDEAVGFDRAVPSVDLWRKL